MTTQYLSGFVRGQLAELFSGRGIDPAAVRQHTRAAGAGISGACATLSKAVVEQLAKISRSPSIAGNGGDRFNLSLPDTVERASGSGDSASNFEALKTWAKTHLGVEVTGGVDERDVTVRLPTPVIRAAHGEYLKVVGPELPPLPKGELRRFVESPRRVPMHPLLQLRDTRFAGD